MLKRIKSYFSAYPNVFRRYVSYLDGEKGSAFWITLMLVIITAANTGLLWLIGMPLSLISNNEIGQLNQVLLVMTVVVVVKYCLHFLYDKMRLSLGLRFICRVRQAFLSYVTKLSFNGVASYSKGDLLARLSNDIEQLKIIVVDIPLLVLSHTLVMGVYIAMLVWIDWRLSLIAMCIAPVFYLLQRALAPVKGRASEAFYNFNGQLLGYEDQVVSNLHGISSFNAEQQIQDKHAGIVEKTRFWSLRALVIDSIYEAGFSWLTYVTAIILIYFGVDAIQAGRIDVGKLFSFLLFLGYLSVPLRGFAQIPLQFQGALGAANRLTELFARKGIVLDTLGSIKIPNQADDAGSIELEHVSFGFAGGPIILSDVSCRFNPGETVAIVGVSGSGKTTLANLLLRFFDVEQGVIRVNGLELKNWPIRELREMFSVVWQQPFLVNGSVRENLCLAQPDAQTKVLQQACELSHSWEFISRFPQGLDTLIGPGGMVLSAGQCQRLSIAQAFLRDAPFLILDEASSALDSQSEQAIVASLQKLRVGRTTLIIAHRYSSIRTADRICFFNGDGTIEMGTHEQLYRSHGTYQQAIDWQTKGRL